MDEVHYERNRPAGIIENHEAAVGRIEIVVEIKVRMDEISHERAINRE